jgi:predicted ABC-type ATPase
MSTATALFNVSSRTVLNKRTKSISVSALLNEADSDCTWITKDGAHICIGGKGDVVKGPKKLVGQTIKKDIAPKYDTSKAPTRELGPHETTKEAFYNDGTKEWNASRAAYHDQVIQQTIGDAVAPKGQPTAVILGGGTASGKTTATRQFMHDDKNTVVVDPDTLKLAIPEYSKLKATDPQYAAARVHEESSMLTKGLLARTIANGLNFVYDTTTSGNGGPQLVKTLLAHGYKVEANFVDIPISTAVSRAATRAKESTDPVNRGRNVPLDIIYGSHTGAARAFMGLKDLKGISVVRLLDNTGKEAKVVYERSGNKVTINDRQFWNRYKRKAQGIAEALFYQSYGDQGRR